MKTHIYNSIVQVRELIYPQTFIVLKRFSEIKAIRRINNFRWNLACKINRYRKTMLIFTAEYLNRIRWYIWIFKCTFGNPILQFTHQVPTKMYSRNRTVISCRTRRLKIQTIRLYQRPGQYFTIHHSKFYYINFYFYAKTIFFTHDKCVKLFSKKLKFNKIREKLLTMSKK